MHISNGACSILYLMQHKILMNVGFGFARVLIKEIRISEGLLFPPQKLGYFLNTFLITIFTGSMSM